MDKARFKEICDTWLVSEREKVGIGTQSEKSLHAILKRYFEPDTEKHEVKVGTHIADIAREGEIIEIQTRDLYRLAPKLSTFLVENRVTVVYPIVEKKRLFWLNKETGECKSVRKSNKCGKEIDLLPELYGLRSFLQHPNFRVCVILLDVNEYRALDGYGKDKKKRATKLDHIPSALLNEIYFESPEDYRRFLPEGLPSAFTSEDYRKTLGCALWSSQRALNILSNLGLIREIGKQGRSKVYEMV
ncbi:MAG: hypothetical protein IJ489_07550 [Clostridia bacterium]|nr:hypothetical protein [Clostridia bacterium]